MLINLTYTYSENTLIENHFYNSDNRDPTLCILQQKEMKTYSQ